MPATRLVDRIERRMGMRTQPAGPAFVRREIVHFIRRLSVLVGLITLLLLAGAAALSAFEDVSYWQGLLWSLDTIATVGAIPAPDTLGGQITKIVLITLGLGTMLYVLVTLTELLVAGELSGLLQARRMQRKISNLNDHYLICGFGRVGRQIARDFRQVGVDFVVVDSNPEIQEAVEEMDVLYIHGRSSEDEVLVEAGVERAAGLVACVDSDAENIFVTLTARQMRPDLHIVARAAEDESEPKLTAAGADEVVSPYRIGGEAMARLVLERGSRRSGHEGIGATLVEGKSSTTAPR
jgi:voltage-gated potassium channel